MKKKETKQEESADEKLEVEVDIKEILDTLFKKPISSSFELLRNAW